MPDDEYARKYNFSVFVKINPLKKSIKKGGGVYEKFLNITNFISPPSCLMVGL